MLLQVKMLIQLILYPIKFIIMGEVKVNANNVNELWLDNEQFLALIFDFTKLFSQLNLDTNNGSILGNYIHVFNLSTNNVQIFGTNVPDTTVLAKSSKLIELTNFVSNATITYRNLGSAELKLMWNFHYSNTNNRSNFNYNTINLRNTDYSNNYEFVTFGGVIIIFNA